MSAAEQSLSEESVTIADDPLKYCTEAHRSGLTVELDPQTPYTPEQFRMDLERHAILVRQTADKKRERGTYENSPTNHEQDFDFCREKMGAPDFQTDPRGFYYTLYRLSADPECPWREGTEADPIELATRARYVAPLGNLTTWTSLTQIATVLIDRWTHEKGLALHLESHGAPMLYFELIRRGHLPLFLIDTMGQGGLPVLMVGGVPPFDNIDESPVSLADYKLDPSKENVVVVGDGEMAEPKLLADLITYLKTPDRKPIQIIVNANGERLDGPCEEKEIAIWHYRLRILAHLMNIKVRQCDGNNAEQVRASITHGQDAIIIAHTEKGHGLPDLPPRGKRHNFVPGRSQLLEGPPGGLVTKVGGILDGNRVSIISPDGTYFPTDNIRVTPIDECKAVAWGIRHARKVKRKEEGGRVAVVMTATPYFLDPWTRPIAFRHVRDGVSRTLDINESLQTKIPSRIEPENEESLLGIIGQEQLPFCFLGLSYTALYGLLPDYLAEMTRHGIQVCEPRTERELERVLSALSWNSQPRLISVTNWPTADDDADSLLANLIGASDPVAIGYPRRKQVKAKEGYLGLRKEHNTDTETVVIAFGSTGVMTERALRDYQGASEVTLVSIGSTKTLLDEEGLQHIFGAAPFTRTKRVLFLQGSATTPHASNPIFTALHERFPRAKIVLKGLDGSQRALQSPLNECLCRGGLCPHGILEAIEGP